MKKMVLDAPSGKCDILIGEKLANVEKYVDAAKAVIITDKNVMAAHGALFPPYEVIEMGVGEGNKTLQTVERIYERFLGMELDRSSFVVGIGGGVVCDVAGYAAATYLRGLDFGLVPTTLLAQVDAAIGGKNGVNFKGYKNIVGTIRQPRFSICDPAVLKTLPQQELRCGFAEVIKSAAIADPHLFSFLEGHVDKAMALDDAAIGRIVADAVAVKVGIVSRDEGEKNERMLLNFGHTLGHALEKTAYLPHGEAVAIGMAAAAELSVSRGMLRKEDAERLKNLIRAFGLPVSRTHSEGVIDAMRKDKKMRGGSMNMVLLEGIGKAKVTEVWINDLEAALNNLH